MLQLLTLENACHELAYEAANRPDWIAVPIKGITGNPGLQHGEVKMNRAQIFTVE